MMVVIDLTFTEHTSVPVNGGFFLQSAIIGAPVFRHELQEAATLRAALAMCRRSFLKGMP